MKTLNLTPAQRTFAIYALNRTRRSGVVADEQNLKFFTPAAIRKACNRAQANGSVSPVGKRLACAILRRLPAKRITGAQLQKTINRAAEIIHSAAGRMPA